MDHYNNFAMANTANMQQQEQPQPPEQRKQRKSAAGRSLIRWDFEKDQHLLLCLEYEAARIGMQLPWDAAVQHIKNGATGQACIQHLAKVRKYRQERGQEVPPEPTKRRATKKNDAPNKKRKVVGDDDDDDEEECERPFNGSTNRMVFEPMKKKTPRRNTAPVTPSSSVAKPSKAPRRRPTLKIKKENSQERMANNQELEADYEDEWKPEAAQPKKKRGRPTRNAIKNEAIKLEAPILNSRLRMTEGINYAEPDTLEELEEEEDGHDNAAYEHHGEYNMGADHADEEYEEAEDVKPKAPRGQQGLQSFNAAQFPRPAGIVPSQRMQDPFVDAARSGGFPGNAMVQSPQIHTGTEVYANSVLPYSMFNGDAGPNHGLGMSWGDGAGFGSNSPMPGGSSHSSSFRDGVTARGSFNNHSGLQTPSRPPRSMSFANAPPSNQQNPSSHAEAAGRTQSYGHMQYPTPGHDYTFQPGPQHYSMGNNGFASYNETSEALFQPMQAPARRGTVRNTPTLSQTQYHQFEKMANSASSPNLTSGQSQHFDNGLPREQHQPNHQLQSYSQPQQAAMIHSASAPDLTETHTMPNPPAQPQLQEQQQSSPKAESTMSAPDTNFDALSQNTGSPHYDTAQVFSDTSPAENGGDDLKFPFGDDNAEFSMDSLVDYEGLFP